MRRYALRDDQWDRIKDILPGREGMSGARARDNRLFVEAVLYRYRAGIPWRDLPEPIIGGQDIIVKPPEMGPLLVSSYKGYELTNAPSNSAVVSELMFSLFDQNKRRWREIP